MKKRIISLLLTISTIIVIFACNNTIQIQAAESANSFKPYTMYVNKDSVKVYSNATSNSKVVKHYSKGKKVTVINKHGNWRKVGEHQWINYKNLNKKNPCKYYKGIKLEYNKKYNVCNTPLTRRMGVKYFQGHKETYYSQRVLPGRGLKIPGRHVANDGTIRDKDGYIVIACNYIKQGECMMTSLGPGKKYDCGDMKGKWIDIYVDRLN